MKLLGYMEVVLLIFWGNFILFYIMFEPICIIPTVYEGSLSSIASPALFIGCHFDDNHSHRCDMISHCSFDLEFADNCLIASIFSCACWPFICILWKNNYSSLQAIFKSIFFLILSCKNPLDILDISSLFHILFANIFFHSLSFLFSWQFPLLWKAFLVWRNPFCLFLLLLLLPEEISLKILLRPMSKNVLPMFLYMNFMFQVFNPLYF